MSIWSRLFHRREMDAELDEEIRSHLSMAQRDRVDRGESEPDASINARREFGNVLLVKEIQEHLARSDDARTHSRERLNHSGTRSSESHPYI